MCYGWPQFCDEYPTRTRSPTSSGSHNNPQPSITVLSIGKFIFTSVVGFSSLIRFGGPTAPRVEWQLLLSGRWCTFVRVTIEEGRASRWGHSPGISGGFIHSDFEGAIRAPKSPAGRGAWIVARPEGQEQRQEKGMNISGHSSGEDSNNPGSRQRTHAGGVAMIDEGSSGSEFEAPLRFMPSSHPATRPLNSTTY